MRRLLRLVLLCLIALALPVQGVLAATTMGAAQSRMTMPDGSTMDAAAMPCHDHGHAVDKGGVCGGCCGPVVVQQVVLDVASAAPSWARVQRHAIDDARTPFLTGGTDRPPRPFLA